MFRVVCVLCLLVCCSAWAGQEGTFGLEVNAKTTGFFSRKLSALTVKSVVQGLPAQRKGLKAGDEIVFIGNCAIPGCPASVAKHYMDKRVGDSVSLGVKMDDGSTRVVELYAE